MVVVKLGQSGSFSHLTFGESYGRVPAHIKHKSMKLRAGTKN